MGLSHVGISWCGLIYVGIGNWGPSHVGWADAGLINVGVG